MTRAYRGTADEIGSRNIDCAAAAAAPAKPVDVGTWVRFATLVPGGTSDDERTWGRRAVARHVLRFHGGDAGVLGELLAVLGLGGEQR